LYISQVRTLISNAIGRVLFVFNVFGLEVIVRCVDYGGIVDYHCLNFLFIALILLLLFSLEFEVAPRLITGNVQSI